MYIDFYLIRDWLEGCDPLGWSSYNDISYGDHTDGLGNDSSLRQDILWSIIIISSGQNERNS